MCLNHSLHSNRCAVLLGFATIIAFFFSLPGSNVKNLDELLYLAEAAPERLAQIISESPLAAIVDVPRSETPIKRLAQGHRNDKIPIVSFQIGQQKELPS